MGKQQVRKIDRFFKIMKDQAQALSYKDVRLATCHSDLLPKDVDLRSKFSRNIKLKIPIVSSPMDTVTEAKMAIALAKEGGLGIIHKALSPQSQAAAVAKAKHHLSAFIVDPICVSTEDTVEKILKMRADRGYDFLSFAVLDEYKHMVGIVASNDFDFCSNPKSKISEIMSTEIIKAEIGISIKEAYQQMTTNRKKILPVFNRDGSLQGIYTWKDVKRIIHKSSENYNLNANGTLLVGAAISVGSDLEERMELLSREKVDVVVIDTAHGDSRNVINAVKFCKKHYPDIDVVAGNISEAESAKHLIKAGADGLRVGQGSGSICTTRLIAGIGCPQVTAVYNCAKAARGSGVPVCADGGIEYSGDIPIALAAGADCVMLGNALAGTTEAPGDIIYKGGRALKRYRGMGSLGAMIDNKTSRERYNQADYTPDKLVPEGVEAEIDYKGDLVVILNLHTGGLRSGMGYVGAKNITDLQRKAYFHRISVAGLAESHPHGLSNIKDAPNYRGEKI